MQVKAYDLHMLLHVFLLEQPVDYDIFMMTVTLLRVNHAYCFDQPPH